MKDKFANALIRHRKERVFGILEQVRDDDRPGHIETELIAPQRGFALAVLPYLVRYGIENVVSEVLIDAPVPEHFRPMNLLRSHWAARPHTHISGQDLKLVSGAGKWRGLW
jgi:hypothetical protein